MHDSVKYFPRISFMHEREKMLKGALCMTVGFCFLATSGALLKAASEGASTLWVTFFAYFFGFLMQCLFVCREGISFLKTKHIGGHIRRAVFGSLTTVLYILSMHTVSLLNATLLLNTAPLFIPVFAIFFLKTKVPVKIWISLLLGFIGVIFILRPNVVLFEKLGNLYGLGAGIAQSLAFIFVKMLTKTEPVKRINFYFFLLSSCFFAPFALYFWETPPLLNWILVFFVGIVSFFSQLFIVKAYHYADASHVGPFQYTAVVFSGLIGWMIWNQIPTFYDLMGVILVILGGILAITLYHGKPPMTSSQNVK